MFLQGEELDMEEMDEAWEVPDVTVQEEEEEEDGSALRKGQDWATTHQEKANNAKNHPTQVIFRFFLVTSVR